MDEIRKDCLGRGQECGDWHMYAYVDILAYQTLWLVRTSVSGVR